MGELHLEIVTPTKLLDVGMINYVRCPGLDGLFGVMAQHQNAIVALNVGEIKVTQNNKDNYFATSGGFADITKDKVQILVETIERSNEIDAGRAKESLDRAKERLNKDQGEIDQGRIDISMTRAINRIKVANR